MKYCSNIRIMFSKHFNEIGKVIWSDWHSYPSGSNLLTPWGKVIYPISAESTSPALVIATLLPPSGGIDCVFPEEMVMASSCHARQYRFFLGPTSRSSLCFLTITEVIMGGL